MDVTRALLRPLLRAPLLHFAVLGAAIFALFQWTEAPRTQTGERRILIDDDALRTFVQYQTRNFDDAAAEERLRHLSAAEVDDIIEALIREEALYREARALNLAEHDYVIRRRLAQKMEFIAEDAAAAARLADGDARRHYQQHRQDYYAEPAITFAQVYFDPARHGRDAARALAEAKRGELNRQAAPFEAAPRHGDRFLYHVNYVERSPGFIASHFGPAMAKQLFAQEPDDKNWRGPFESEHGFHLALVAENRPGRIAEFAEVAERVKADARQAQIRKRTEAAVQALVDRHEVRIDLSSQFTEARQSGR